MNDKGEIKIGLFIVPIYKTFFRETFDQQYVIVWLVRIWTYFKQR